MSHYEFTFVNSIFNSFEVSYYVSDETGESKLIGIAICDEGEVGLSAVYTYYDPDYANLSLGTYSVLYQIELCRRLGVPYLYLGYYVADCRSLNYKARFLPHERLVDGQWQRFESLPEEGLVQMAKTPDTTSNLPPASENESQGI